MSSKLNSAALNQYCKTYSKQVCNDFFEKNIAISGQQLLQLTDIPQVNLFVMSTLYEKWKADAENFKSPYFNFESETVKNALQTFMNTISQNISVKREHLEPLLIDATKNTLSLLLDTQNYFSDIFKTQPDMKFTAETLKQISKYTKLNQFIPQTIASNMGERSFSYSNQVITWLEEIMSQYSDKLEPSEPWIAKFSEILPLNSNDLFKKTNKIIAEPIAVVSENKEVENSFDTAEIEPTTLKVEQKEPVILSVNESAQTEESLNESLKTDQESMAQTLQNQPITNISDSIPLHQKFMFIHQLFSGSNGTYESTIHELEQAPNYESAYQMVIYQLASKHDWDITNEAVTDLIDILKRRFS